MGNGTKGTADDGGATSDATPEYTAAAGAGGYHGAGKRDREKVSCRQEKSADKSSGVGEEEGGPKASRVEENPRRDRQGVGGGVESPRGTNTHGVEEFPGVTKPVE